MPDDFRALDSAELIGDRESAHFRRMGVSELGYPQTLAAAVAHANAPRATAGTACTWYSTGPRNIGGRIIAIAQEPDNPLVLYAGSAHGGLWVTRDGGDTWANVSDPANAEVHSEPVGAIAIARQRPNVLLVGTGSAEPNYVSGSGLWRVDVAADPAASTFTLLAGVDAPDVAPSAATLGKSFRHIRLRFDPENPDRFWSATQTGLWRREPLPIPTFIREFPPDAGAPAEAPPLTTSGFGLTDVGWPPYCTDVLVAPDPRNDSKHTEDGIERVRYLVLFVAIHGKGIFRGRFDREDRRVRWDGKLDLPNEDLYSGGRRFSRIRLAQCESEPAVVYAVFSSAPTSNDPAIVQLERNHASHVFRSDDCGNHWTPQGQIPRAAGYTNRSGQADYCMVLEVNPRSPDIVVCGEIDLCLSTDKAKTWVPILNWTRYDSGDFAQHADQHAAHFDVTDLRRLWVGNDGGLSMARDLRLPPQAPGYWRKRSHAIVAAQFNDVTVHPTPALAFMCGGGLQDNGTYAGFGGLTWYHIGWGDGGAMAIHAGNPSQFIVGRYEAVNLFTVIARPPTVGISAPVVPDVTAINSSMNLDGETYPIPGKGPFVAVLEQDPLVPGQFLTGWIATASDSIAYRVPAPLSAAPAVPPTSPALGPITAALPGTALVVGRINPPGVVIDKEEATAVAIGPVAPGPEIGPPPPPPPASRVDAWIGTSRGQLVYGNDLAAAGSFSVRPNAPHVMTSIGRAISEIVVHPQDAFTVAVATVPRTTGLVVLQITAAGATGAASFVVFFFGSGHLHGPVTTGSAVPIPGSPFTVQFSGNYAAGDNWTILANGRIIPNGSTATTITVVSAVGSPVSIVIDTPGAVGTATFRAQVGALPASPPQTTASRIELSSAPLILFFTGPLAAGDRWTVSPGGAVVPASGNSATAKLHALGSDRGCVFLSYDRGSTWQDVSAPAPPPARPTPDLDSLPPGPVAALEWDQAAPTRLFAGTLVGVYELPNIPTPTALTISAKPATLPSGTSQQLAANLTMTSGGPIDCTQACDWFSSNTAAFTVTASGLLAIAAGGAVGAASRIRARRGMLTDFFDITVAAAAPGAASAAPAAFVPPVVPISWRPSKGGLPLVLINDLTTIPGTRILRAATFGRGIWDCNLAGDVTQQAYVRQTIVEDGRTYPRAIPQAAPGVPLNDPRLPQAGPNAVALDSLHAYDIRVDAPPFTFLDDVVDGVEFDEQLPVNAPIPSEINYVYVQVQNAGVTELNNTTVHLYWALVPPLVPANPTGASNPAALDAAGAGGAPIADFYGQPNRDPITTSLWKRVDTAKSIHELRTGSPVVIRFTFVPDASIERRDVALLAMVEPQGGDALPLPLPAGSATLSAFIQNERRAALRIVKIAPRPPARLFVRDGISDDTRIGGYPVGGRSPDIMVRHPDITRPAADEFADLLAQHPTDTLQGSGGNIIYVRVHNDSRFEVRARVMLFAVKLDGSNRPDTTIGNWIQLPIGGPAVEVPIPARGVAYARVEWPTPIADPAPGSPSKAYLLVALVEDTAAPSTDPLPDRNRVTDVDSMWSLITRFVDSDNAAARAVWWIA